MWKRILAIAAVAVALAAVLFYSQWHSAPLKVSGFIEANEIRIGSRVGGRVRQVRVEEGQTVKAGDVLIELEPYDLTEKRAEAAAKLAAQTEYFHRLQAGSRPEEIAQAKAKTDELAARLQLLQAGPRKQEIAAGQARVTLATAQLTLARSAFARVKASFDRNAASTDEMENATEAVNSAQATLDVRRAELDQLIEGTRPQEITQAEAQLREAQAVLALMQAGSRAQDIASAKASMDAAEAALAAIDRQIAELTIRAPADGQIEAMDLQPGDLVGAGSPALSILDFGELWVRTYIPENRLNIALGQELRVTVDSFRGTPFRGKVSFIARQAEFTPGNIQTPEERSKQVFRIKVTLEDGAKDLRPGMSADVWLP